MERGVKTGRGICADWFRPSPSPQARISAPGATSGGRDQTNTQPGTRPAKLEISTLRIAVCRH
jgi:hypothetical protein